MISCAVAVRPETEGSTHDRAVEPQACAGCHAEITAEWRASLHARSFEDPIFQAEYAPAPSPECVACHAPLAEDLSAPEPRARAEGVSCVHCHMDARGRILAGRVRTPGREPSPHDIHRSDRLASNATCYGCHEFGFPAARSPGELPYDAATLQQETHREWAASPSAARGETCVACHLPRRADGRVDHRSLGVTRALLQRALAIEARVEETDEARVLTLTLHATEVGHAVPTGDIFRRLVVEAEGPSGVERESLRRYFGVRHLDGALRQTEVDDTRPAPGVPSVVRFRFPRAEGLATPIRWRVQHARLDPEVAALRGLSMASVLTTVFEGEAR